MQPFRLALQTYPQNGVPEPRREPPGTAQKRPKTAPRGQNTRAIPGKGRAIPGKGRAIRGKTPPGGPEARQESQSALLRPTWRPRRPRGTPRGAKFDPPGLPFLVPRASISQPPMFLTHGPAECAKRLNKLALQTSSEIKESLKRPIDIVETLEKPRGTSKQLTLIEKRTNLNHFQ